jgi:hypothetical protein
MPQRSRTAGRQRATHCTRAPRPTHGTQRFVQLQQRAPQRNDRFAALQPSRPTGSVGAQGQRPLCKQWAWYSGRKQCAATSCFEQAADYKACQRIQQRGGRCHRARTRMGGSTGWRLGALALGLGRRWGAAQREVCSFPTPPASAAPPPPRHARAPSQPRCRHAPASCPTLQCPVQIQQWRVGRARLQRAGGGS